MELNDNIDKFFIILNSLIKLDSNQSPKTGITVFVFKNDVKDYNIYFGLRPEVITNYQYRDLINIIANSNEEILSKNRKILFQTNLFPHIKNVSEEEINYILFAFCKMYDASNLKYNDKTETVVEINSDYIIFNCIDIFFSKSIIDLKTLEQHFIGTKRYITFGENNFEQRKKEALYNNKKGYRKYVNMLKYFESRANKNPILAAYNFSIDQFESIIQANPSFIEDINNETKPNKMKKLNNIIKLF